MISSIRRRSLATALLYLFVATGCQPALPPEASPERAKAALQSALDAWQNGETTEALAKRSPPIYFNDDFWKEGIALQKYEIVSGAPNGRGWSSEVKLTFGDSPNSPRTIRYLIDTDPAIVIVQQP